MSIRALWLLSPGSTGDWQVVYTRRFNVVEKEAQRIHGESYTPIPRDNQQIATAILGPVGLEKTTAEIFVETRDSCLLRPKMPVIRVNIINNNGDKLALWPIVIVEHCGHLLCCLPSIGDPKLTADSINSLLEIAEVTTAFSTLLSVQSYLGPLKTPLTASDKLVVRLDKYVSLAFPFGRIGELDPSLIQTALTNAPIQLKPVHSRRQGRKPPHSDKPQTPPKWLKGQPITIRVSEFIRSVQYNNPTIKDVLEVYGTLTWNGCLERENVNLTFNLSSSNSNRLMPLQAVALHPCTTSVDISHGNTTARKFRVKFPPALTSFPLCYYTVRARTFPIRGSYKLKSINYQSDLFEINLKLTLDEEVKNNLDFLEVYIPIPNGSISRHDFEVSWGAMSISKDGRNFIWTIGQKFPGKAREVSLSGNFKMSAGIEDSVEFINYACAILHFRIADYTYSGFSIDLKSVMPSVPVKVKMNCDREFISAEYKLWNECGEAVPVHFSQKLVSQQNT